MHEICTFRIYSHNVFALHIGAWQINWLIFFRRHFHICFIDRKMFYLNTNICHICSFTEEKNDRPVTVFTALSKIYENVFNIQMSQYFDLIFSNFLSGFRHKYSCQTTLVRMIEEWKEALDNGKMVGTVAVDLSKAFDSLPHGLLIAKSVAYGMVIKSCKLISSYLFNRYQRVKVGSSKSDWCQIKRGVPQGSILGPLLFNVFINYIFSFYENRLQNF